jgi:hypothetical protein
VRSSLIFVVECRDVFSLITKKLGDSEEKLLSFFISDETTKKAEFLTSLSKTVCTSQCRADYVCFTHFVFNEFCSSAKTRLVLTLEYAV